MNSFFCLTLICSVSHVIGQSLSFSGRVIDQAGNPLPWALIRLDASSTVTQSLADGSFAFTGTTQLGNRFHANPNHTETRAEAHLEVVRGDGRNISDTYDNASPTFSHPTPPAHIPPLEKTASAYSLAVSKVNYQPATFPQSTASATGLVLTLLKSLTDTATYVSEKKLCLDTINACRASLNLKPVTWSKSLEAFADEGAKYDAGFGTAHGHFTKFSPRAVPSDAENAIPGWPLKNYKTVGAVVQKGIQMMWAEGPGGGHYENIKGDQTQVGCGIFVTTTDDVWIVQDFK